MLADILGILGFLLAVALAVWQVRMYLEENKENVLVRASIQSGYIRVGVPGNPELGLDVVNIGKPPLFVRDVGVLKEIDSANEAEKATMFVGAQPRSASGESPIPRNGARYYFIELENPGLKSLAKSDSSAELHLVVDTNKGRIYDCCNDEFRALVKSAYRQPPEDFDPDREFRSTLE